MSFEARDSGQRLQDFRFRDWLVQCITDGDRGGVIEFHTHERFPDGLWHEQPNHCVYTLCG
jgi:hypothetical protein